LQSLGLNPRQPTVARLFDEFMSNRFRSMAGQEMCLITADWIQYHSPGPPAACFRVDPFDGAAEIVVTLL
jgi:hypothetical protein